MRYIAMQLRLLLHTKFPEAPEDDILKVIGNLLYYRYMNPAIVAPDAFDVVDVGVGAESQLTPEQVCCVCVICSNVWQFSFVCSTFCLQRRNLGSIAKVLQHASACKLVSSNVAIHFLIVSFVLSA